MARPVRVHGDGLDDAVITSAVRWARQIADRSDVEEGQVRNYYLPATMAGRNMTVRVYQAHIDVFVSPSVAQSGQDAQLGTAFRARMLASGYTHDIFISDGTNITPITMYPPSGGSYTTTQLAVSVNEARKDIPGLEMASDNEASAARRGAYTRVRPSWYSGHMRSLVQCAQAIGYGAEYVGDNPTPEQRDRAKARGRKPAMPDRVVMADAMRDYERMTFSFTHAISDGVLFVRRPKRGLLPVLDFEYRAQGHDDVFVPERIPVLARLHTGRRKVYITRVLPWAGIVDNHDAVTIRTRGFASWYTKVVDPDTAILFDAFGFIPSGETALSLRTTVFREVNGERRYDLTEAVRQRINAGIIAEVDMDIDQAAAPFSNDLGWAFSYTTPEAATVVYKRDAGADKTYSSVVTAKLDIAVRDEIRGPNAAALDKLTSVVSYYIEEGVLDYIASSAKLFRMSTADAESLAAMVYDGATLESLEPVARRFADLVVENDFDVSVSFKTNWRRYNNTYAKKTVEVLYTPAPGSLSSAVPTPVEFGREDTGAAAVEVKFPSYTSGIVGCLSSLAGLVLRASPTLFVAPVAVWYTPDGGKHIQRVIAQLDSSGQVSDSTDVISGGNPDCILNQAGIIGPVHRLAGSSFTAEMDSVRITSIAGTQFTQFKQSMTYTFLGHSTGLAEITRFFFHLVGYNHYYQRTITTFGRSTIGKQGGLTMAYGDREVGAIGTNWHGVGPAMRTESGGPIGAIKSPSYIETSACRYGQYAPLEYVDLCGHCGNPAPSLALIGRIGGFAATTVKYYDPPGPCADEVPYKVPKIVSQCDEFVTISPPTSPEAYTAPTEVDPGALAGEVYMTARGVGTAAQVYSGRGESVEQPGSLPNWFWTNPSPSRDSGLIASLSANTNCLGAFAMRVDVDFNKPGRERIVGPYPDVERNKPVIFIGVAL